MRNEIQILSFEVGSVEEEERQIEQLIELKNRNISLLGKRSRDTKNLDIEGSQDLHQEEERGSSTKSTAARNPPDVPIIKREILPSSDGQRECIGKPDGDVENQIMGKRIRRPNSLFEDSKLIVGPTPKRSSSFDLYPKIDERRNQGVVHNSVPVEQYHPTSGVVVHRYSSQREAALAMQVSHKAISRCCRGELDTLNGFGYRFYRGPPIDCECELYFCNNDIQQMKRISNSRAGFPLENFCAVRRIHQANVLPTPNLNRIMAWDRREELPEQEFISQTASMLMTKWRFH